MRLQGDSRRSSRLAPVLALGLGILMTGSSLVQGAEVKSQVQSYGLQPIDPPRPAADFSLPQFDGEERALSDLAGDWVVLTFWASWCGPCRSEMPSLEALHQSHADKGVVVLGVSVDQNRPAAKAFIDQHQLSFLQLWDEQSLVGRAYQATAIPMSYLIDPQGLVVALSRGARDWTQLASLMDSLLVAVPPSSASEAVYAEALELPGVSDPPSADLLLSDDSPQAGDEFFLDIHLRWAGSLEEYMPQIPKVHLPEGVVQKGVTASTSSREGDQVVLYRVTLEAAEPGTYALDPVELRYQPRSAMDVATTRMVGPTVIVEPQRVAGLSPQTLALVTGGVAATAVATLAAGWWWRSRRTQDPEPTGSQFDELMSRFQAARKLRMQGDGAGFALVMLDLLDELRDPSESGGEQMITMAERLRFGGHVPPASELDQLQREVGRRLEAGRPNQDLIAREALRLQDDEERS